MTYVFGDIHGWNAPFRRLLDTLSPGANDTVITLGDYIDRGPDSKGVLDTLLQLESSTQLIALRGNHEIMMQDARNGPPNSRFWLLNGGIETLESYHSRHLGNLPESHWRLLSRLTNYYELPSVLFTHATPDHTKSPADFTEEDLFWSRFENPSPRLDNRLLICGHTPQESTQPTLQNNHLCLDTGMAHEGLLTALTLETGNFLQTNSKNHPTSGHLELPKLTPEKIGSAP
ncbi:MAG: metallophosphoesterase family protein [Verrucomicrobiota bacterium]